MAGESFLGNWEVTICGYVNCDNKVLQRVCFQFHLEADGTVTWSYPNELKLFPLFSCDTYEIYTTSNLEVFIRFGVIAGHVLEFRSDQFEPKDEVLLTCSSFCFLKCKRVTEDQYRPSDKFTFLQALDEGYFTDVTLTASNKKQFKAHSTILKLIATDVDWASDPPPFSELSEEAFGVLLHFLYSECISESITESSANELIQSASKYESLGKLVHMCKIFLKNLALKQQIINLISDVHDSVAQIIEHFKHQGTGSENLAGNPSLFCYMIKQSIRDIIAVGVSLLLLCDLFHKTKNILSKNDRNDIITYAKTQLPAFLTQLTDLVIILKDIFTTISPAQTKAIASFLASEMGVIMQKVAAIMFQIQRGLRQVIQKQITSYTRRSPHVKGHFFRYILDMGEISKLRFLQQTLFSSYLLLKKKRASFEELTLNEMIQSITRDLELLYEELPICLMRLEEDKIIFDEKLNCREFHFCFIVGTSKVASILNKLVLHRDEFQSVLHQICDIVKTDSFNQCLKDMGMLDEQYNAAAKSDHTHKNEEVDGDESQLDYDNGIEKIINCFERSRSSREISPFSDEDEEERNDQETFDYENNICTPPPARESTLTKHCKNLLNGEDTDMEFEVVHSKTAEDDTPEDGVTIFKAHRVIVASRCDWFRRALLSGMKEDIDKKVIVHETNPEIFQIFLNYLYTHNLETRELSNDQLIDLIVLSDRYEVDSLKQTCEYSLQPSIDLETALYYVNLADQYNSNILKDVCMDFITKNEELLESDEFFKLSLSLQVEIFDCIMKPCVQDKYIEVSSDDIDSSTEPQLYFERNKLELCLTQIRDIVGNIAPRETLVRVILAADYDLCRAVNFFYARN